MFAWCFDHGRPHNFLPDSNPEEVCSASWVPLLGDTEEEAMRHKQLVWGDAQFFDQLPLDRQGGLIAITEMRKNRGSAVVHEGI